MTARKPYPSDVSDAEGALVAPYLCLLREDAPQRTHPLREVFNGLRYLVRYGVAWRALPNDLPPWHAVSDQAVRWLRAGCFERLAPDLRAVLRLAWGRTEEPSAAVLDSRTLRSTPESGRRAGGRGGRQARHRPEGGQAARGQARLRVAAPPMGGRAQLRLDGALPAARARL